MKIGWFPVVTDSIERQRAKERKSRKVKETKSQRDKESKRQRVKETKSLRVKETKRGRDGGSILAWSAVRPRRCVRMAKMQGAEDEGAGSGFPSPLFCPGL